MPELKAAAAVYHFSQRGISRGLGMTITSLENGRWSKITGRVEELTEVVEELFAAADGDRIVAKPVCLASSLAMGCVRFLSFSSSLSSANCPKSRARSLIAGSILSPCELDPRVTHKTE
jgi:hypothetical protein